MASLGVWTLPFCSLARISPTFCSVASLPIQSTPLFFLGWHLNGVGPVAKIRYQAVGFPYNRMLKLSSSKGIRIDVPVRSVSWSVEDHSVIIQALRKGLIEHEASDTGGVPRWKSSCPDRLAEATISRYFSELCGRRLAEELGRCCRLQQLRRCSE